MITEPTGGMDTAPAHSSRPRSGYCERGCHHLHIHCDAPASPDRSPLRAAAPPSDRIMPLDSQVSATRVSREVGFSVTSRLSIPNSANRRPMLPLSAQHARFPQSANLHVTLTPFTLLPSHSGR